MIFVKFKSSIPVGPKIVASAFNRSYTGITVWGDLSCLKRCVIEFDTKNIADISSDGLSFTLLDLAIDTIDPLASVGSENPTPYQ